MKAIMSVRVSDGNWKLQGSGIYTIINDFNDRVYIGSSVNLSTRWSQHKCSLRGNRHPNRPLQFDWNRYGKHAFSFNVIEHLSGGELIDAERKWQEYYKDRLYQWYDDALAVRIDLDTAALAQRLMLRDWPGVSNVEQLFTYALRRLAETTND